MFLSCGMSAGLGLALAATSASADGYVGGVKGWPACCDSWSGFYLGVHGGYGWKENDFDEVVALNPLVNFGNINSKGSVWGGQAGYNWQRGSIVGGPEIDFSRATSRIECALRAEPRRRRLRPPTPWATT